MTTTISSDEFLGISPMRGSLTGTFQDCLDYLDWSINVFAGKGNMSADKKGKAFADAVQTLKDRFGMQISTHYLKQFCDKQKHKNLHIKYILRLADYKTNPCKQNFKGGIANGRRCIVPKIFDMLLPRVEYEIRELQAQQFKARCLAEWDARDKALAEQKLAVQKLQILANLEDKPMELQSDEVEEVAPDLMVPDLELRKLQAHN